VFLEIYIKEETLKPLSLLLRDIYKEKGKEEGESTLTLCSPIEHRFSNLHLNGFVPKRGAVGDMGDIGDKTNQGGRALGQR